MDALDRTSIAVLGMGNLLYSDDGAGIVALHLLDGTGAVPGGTSLIDGSAFGLEAAALIAGADKLLVLDAVDAGAAPGTLVRMDRRDLEGMNGGSTVHRLGIADLLAALGLMARMPAEVVLLGIQPGSTGLGFDMTPAVAEGVAGLVSAGLRQLEEWRAPAGG